MVKTKTELEQDTEQIQTELKEQKKVKVRIPRNIQSDKDTYVPVCINGYVYQIQRGIDVDVPETVKEVLEESGYLG